MIIIINIVRVQSLAQEQNNEKEIKVPTQVRMLRIYGGDDETLPPVVLMKSFNSQPIDIPFGTPTITIEFDIDAPVPPALYARFFHCSLDWNESDNVFLNDIAYTRSSNISWKSAPIHSSYYTYRGTLSVPNEQVKFLYPGNWKVKIYEYYSDSVCLVEGRFFVVNPKSECAVQLVGEFYTPNYPVSQSALTIEATVRTSQQLFDNRLNTVVIYRKNRWAEPFYIAQNSMNDPNARLYKYKFPTLVAGFGSMGKIFRIERMPAENGYRVLNLTDLALYPRTGSPIRMPFSDWRRVGMYNERHDDGAMITTFISSYNDDYVNMEFVLDPDGWISNEDVFIAGSFNNWEPDGSWQMYYDEDDRFYKLRHWVRRGRHNYLYGTGRFNMNTNRFVKFAFDEFEGNTGTAGHTFMAFVYYREFDYGGYDALIGIGAANVYGSIVR